MNAIDLPSGDHLGPLLLPVVLVSCFCVLPSVESSQRLDELSSLSMSQVVTSTTHHLPSGETDGGPTRLIFHKSSAVIGRGPAACTIGTKSAIARMANRALPLMV